MNSTAFKIHIAPQQIESLPESETNKTFGAAKPSNDTFQLYRFLMHADLKYRESFRIFVQGIEAFEEDRDLAPRPSDENEWDIHQLFFDLRFLGEESPWTLRVGRQELSYGNQRLVSPLEWSNVRRRFDGVKVFARTEKWDIDAFFVKPVPVKPVQFDDNEEDVDFYGVYTTYKGISRHGVDVYFFGLNNTGDPLNPNQNAGDKNIYTLGSRFWGKTKGWDYEAEFAGQWGHWASDTVQAWAVALDGGYTFSHKAKPRLGAGWDWATGDKNPNDSSVQTFDQLYPLGHKYLGFLDLVGRQNINAPNVNFSVCPIQEKVQAAAAWRYFWLEQSRDALYYAAGAPTRRDTTDQGGKNVGNELDLTIMWKVDMHSTLLVGWSHFWDADFIQQTGPSRNAELFYVQFGFKF